MIANNILRVSRKVHNADIKLLLVGDHTRVIVASKSHQRTAKVRVHSEKVTMLKLAIKFEKHLQYYIFTLREATMFRGGA